MQNQMDEVEEVKSSPMSAANMTPKTPKSPLVSRFMATPLGSPMKAAMTSMRGYLEEVGHLTKLDHQDAWLPITESRNGNALYSAFHTLRVSVLPESAFQPSSFLYLSLLLAGNSFN
ncbi:hypothetical protein ACFX13_016331 [Malus domestica]|uniref:Uncharacterized protein n=1 Tax=Malus domestica TaxID=3750 RepID=A0A498HTT4_MALDO|nr:hypothetical protein DVH24_013066 [Malus domestica]